MLFSRLLLPLLFLAGIVTAAPIGAASTAADLVTRASGEAAKRTEANLIIKQIKAKLRPPVDGAVFWSGLKHGPDGSTSAMHEAQKFAKNRESMTIEMALAEAGIKIPSMEENCFANDIWKEASKIWAKKSRGSVNTVHGDMRPKNIYNTVELPQLKKLMAKGKVARITEHDTNTGQSVVHTKAPKKPR